VQERNIWPSVTVVALVAGVVTALLYTNRGRQSLLRFDEALDEFGRSLQQLRSAVEKAGLVAAQGIDVATEGLQAVSGLIGKADQRPAPRVTH
jgi:hypothetical protein